MNALETLHAIQHNLKRRGISLDIMTVRQLRRIEQRLHRWAENECGNSNGRASWCIVRDEDTGTPYRETHYYDGTGSIRHRVADLETAALKRLAALCATHKLHYWHQTDPRGCALYIAREPMTDSDYPSIGVAICA